MNVDTIVQQSSRTASRIIDGQAVVVVIDTQRLHTLNSVGSRVWALAEERKLGEIARSIAEEFGADHDVVVKDVLAFAEELFAHGMLEVVNR